MAQAKLYVRNYTSGSNVPGYYGEENVTYSVMRIRLLLIQEMDLLKRLGQWKLLE